MELKMENEVKLKALDLFNLGHVLWGFEGSLILHHSWGNIKSSLGECAALKDTAIIGFIGHEAESKLSELERKYTDDEAELDQDDYSNLENMINRWRGRLDIVSKRWVLCVPQAHLDVADLAEGVKSFFKEDELNVLNSLEKHGFNEAASSLLYNNFTSAEFMTLRSVESILRRWYQKKTGNKLQQERWGDILEKLSQLYPKKSERPKELSLLDYLRGRRNEIAHPGVISSLDEATTTFLNSIAVCKAVKNDLSID
jgi:hypothetical protein